MTFRQKLSSFAAAATILFPIFAEAQDQASKSHYDGIYRGTASVDLFANNSDKQKFKSQLVVYPDGRLVVLTIESSAVRDPINIHGSLHKNVFTGEWKKGFFGTGIACQVTFHGGSAVVSATAKGKKAERWYFEKTGG